MSRSPFHTMTAVLSSAEMCVHDEANGFELSYWVGTGNRFYLNVYCMYQISR